MNVNGKTIKPLTNYVFIKEEENPTIIKKNDHGIILVSDGLAYADDVEGHSSLVKTEQVYKYGVVIDAGPDVKTVKEGDGVFFYVPSVRPLPVGSLETLLLSESNILAYVRDEE